MKYIFTLVAFLLMGMVLANEYCSNQQPLGFEDATFMVGADVSGQQPQAVTSNLLIQLGRNLKQIDSFKTPSTHYELFRVVATNELVLITSSATHICLYGVPTKEPVWRRVVIS